MTNWFLIHLGDKVHELVNDRVEKTLVVSQCGANNHMQHKSALQFFVKAMEDDMEDKSMTFPIESGVEKMAFAQWLIEEKLGEFCDEHTSVFFTVFHRNQFAD